MLGISGYSSPSLGYLDYRPRQQQQTGPPIRTNKIQLCADYCDARPAQTFGPSTKAARQLVRDDVMYGYVGCRLLSQKYWLTGTPHVALTLSGVGVPLLLRQPPPLPFIEQREAQTKTHFW